MASAAVAPVQQILKMVDSKGSWRVQESQGSPTRRLDLTAWWMPLNEKRGRSKIKRGCGVCVRAVLHHDAGGGRREC